MVKRKRVEEDSELEETSSTKHKRIQHKLKVGTAKLGHAFKVAKGFERQKLGRRRKNAASQDKQEDIPRIDAEIAALKVRIPRSQITRVGIRSDLNTLEIDIRYYRFCRTAFL